MKTTIYKPCFSSVLCELTITTNTPLEKQESGGCFEGVIALVVVQQGKYSKFKNQFKTFASQY